MRRLDANTIVVTGTTDNDEVDIEEAIIEDATGFDENDEFDENGEPDGGNFDGISGDGITVSVNPEGQLVITAGSNQESLSATFDLNDLVVSNIQIQINRGAESFMAEIDLTNDELSGTYEINFGGGVEGELSFEVSGNEQSIQATLTVAF